jgi:hypothetical protein
MPEIPDVGAIAQQVKARIKQIEDQLKQHHVLTDELERLRAALVRLEGQARSRVNTGRRNRKPATAQRVARPRCEARKCAGTRAARAEQGQGARRAQGRTHDCFGDREGHRYRHRHREHDAHQDGQDGRACQSRTRLQAAAMSARRCRRPSGCSSLTRPPLALRARRTTGPTGGAFERFVASPGQTIGLPVMVTRRPPRARSPNPPSPRADGARQDYWRPSTSRTRRSMPRCTTSTEAVRELGGEARW